MAERFFTPDPLAVGDYVLEGPEAHHLSSVRRFATGDTVTLFNGDGFEYQAHIISLAKNSVTLQILTSTRVDRERQIPSIVASALPKGDRADYLIEKLTEVGVTRFIPLLTERSIVRPKKTVVEKFERAVIEASKQCGRNRLMMVDSPCPWHLLLSRTDLPDHRFVLHTDSHSLPLAKVNQESIIAVGPEGGFSQQEIEAALGNGWQTRNLGSRILRVETAAVAAVTIMESGSGQA